jgi:hypothetical protein
MELTRREGVAMRGRLVFLLIAAVAGTIALGIASASAARESIPYRWQNCTHVNQKYRHGVGKAGARDRTKSGDPVTNFYRSTHLYSVAMSYNSQRGYNLDRDKDGIACEKH